MLESFPSNRRRWLRAALAGGAGAVLGGITRAAGSLPAGGGAAASDAGAADTRQVTQASTGALPGDLPSGPIRVGILHSTTGAGAEAEAPLRSIARLAVEAINADGGVLGRRLVAVDADPGSSWPRAAILARQLRDESRCAVLVGGWHPAECRAIDAALGRDGDGLLLHAGPHDGMAPSARVLLTGNATPLLAARAIDWLRRRGTEAPHGWWLVGTDDARTRTTHAVASARIGANRRGGPRGAPDVRMVRVPWGHDDFRDLAGAIARAAAAAPCAVVSTLDADAHAAFERELAARPLDGASLQLIVPGAGDEPHAGASSAALEGRWLVSTGGGHWPTAAARTFARHAGERLRIDGLPTPALRAPTDAMEATWVGLWLWRAAVERAGSVEPAAVRATLPAVRVVSPSGFPLTVDAARGALRRPLAVRRCDGSGRASIAWCSDAPACA